jgi:hypothetical protein
LFFKELLQWGVDTSAVKSKARTSAGGGASSSTPKTSSISTIITAKPAKEQKQKAPSKQVKAISSPKTALPKCTAGGSGGFRQSNSSGSKGGKQNSCFSLNNTRSVKNKLLIRYLSVKFLILNSYFL